MNYLSLAFYFFILIFLAVYYVLPQKYRYIAIFAGSYFFYGYADIKMTLVLFAITALTFLGGYN